MSLLIKICGIRERRHVDAAIESGADAIGFVFADSVRNISPQDALEISRDMPKTVQRIAVMRHPANELWDDVLQVFAPDVLQTDAGDFATLNVPASVECWPVYREGRSKPNTDDVYVYEGSNSGSGEAVNWTNAAAIATRGQMILAGGLAAQNVATAIAAVRPFGIDVSSALESAPGKKSARRIAEFINAARAAESYL